MTALILPLRRYLAGNPLALLLVVLPLAILAEILGWGPVWVFVLSAIGVIPMAGFIGEATESLATFTGPRIGGLLNATLGNAAELIITLVGLRAGLNELVKASITGSIIGNLLLVLGFSMAAGGIKNGIQLFDRRISSNQAILLTLSILALVIPSFFSHSINAEGGRFEALSLVVAGVMIVLYLAGLLYTLHGPAGTLFSHPATSGDQEVPQWSIKITLIILALATAGVVVLSELLVGAVEPVVSTLGLSEFFIGIILIPIIGNVAEHVVAVQSAIKNQMDLSVEIAVSSSLQIALFVAPLLIFVSLAFGNPLNILFNVFELIALGAAVLITILVSADGESNWLEGAAMLAVYLILGASFFLMPS